MARVGPRIYLYFCAERTAKSMTPREQLWDSLLPLVGGAENITRHEYSEGSLIISLKDRGLVDLEALSVQEYVETVQQYGGLLHLTLQQQNLIQEVTTMASNYSQLISVFFDAIGGKENIVYFQHCTTRLRLNLKDKTTVQLDTLKNTPKVLGCQWSNDELQIIIGPAVADAYEELCRAGGLKQEKPVDENLDPFMEKKPLTVKSLLVGILDGISGSITPLIPMMIGGGMVKVLTMLLSMSGILATDSSTYTILTWLGDAFMYFFPVFLGATSAKKFGANQGLGMLLGALLIYPSFITAATDGASLSIFGLPVYVTNYASTVIPIILTVFVLSKLEKLISRFSPDMVKSFLVPTLSLVIMLPIMLVVTAPIGYYIGTFVANAVIWIYETIGFLGVSVLCALLPAMVMTGMHTMMTPYWTTAFATLGHDPFFLPAMIISNWNQFAACLAVGIRAKNKNIKSTAFSCAVTGIIGGVTEPGMFGITFRYKRPFVAAMIGNAIGGLIAGLLKVSCYAFPGSGGIFAAVTFVGPGNNLVYFFIAALVGMAATFILTTILGIDEEA